MKGIFYCNTHFLLSLELCTLRRCVCLSLSILGGRCCFVYMCIEKCVTCVFSVNVVRKRYSHKHTYTLSTLVLIHTHTQVRFNYRLFVHAHPHALVSNNINSVCIHSAIFPTYTFSVFGEGVE